MLYASIRSQMETVYSFNLLSLSSSNTTGYALTKKGDLFISGEFSFGHLTRPRVCLLQALRLLSSSFGFFFFFCKCAQYTILSEKPMQDY